LTKKTWNVNIEVQQNLERVNVMDKDTILAAARNEKHKGKEFENKESARSGLLSSAIALLVGIGLFLLEYFVRDSVNIGLIAVGMTACGVDYLYTGVTLKQHYKTVIGTVQLLIALLFILFFVAKVVAV
jgi:hypothetical protein